MFKQIAVQIIGGLAIALLVLVSSAFSSPIDWNGFESEVDAALDRAEARTDAKFNVPGYLTKLDSAISRVAHRADCGPGHDCPQNRHLAELDCIIERNHRIFVKKHDLKIKSLISRERTDALLESYRANDRLDSLVQEKQFKLLLELRDRVEKIEAHIGRMKNNAGESQEDLEWQEKGEIPGQHPEGNQGQGHDQEKRGEASKVAQCSRSWLEAFK